MSKKYISKILIKNLFDTVRDFSFLRAGVNIVGVLRLNH